MYKKVIEDAHAIFFHVKIIIYVFSLRFFICYYGSSYDRFLYLFVCRSSCCRWHLLGITMSTLD